MSLGVQGNEFRFQREWNVGQCVGVDGDREIARCHLVHIHVYVTRFVGVVDFEALRESERHEHLVSGFRPIWLAELERHHLFGQLYRAVVQIDLHHIGNFFDELAEVFHHRLLCLSGNRLVVIRLFSLVEINRVELLLLQAHSLRGEHHLGVATARLCGEFSLLHHHRCGNIRHVGVKAERQAVDFECNVLSPQEVGHLGFDLDGIDFRCNGGGEYARHRLGADHILVFAVDRHQQGDGRLGRFVAVDVKCRFHPHRQFAFEGEALARHLVCGQRLRKGEAVYRDLSQVNFTHAARDLLIREGVDPIFEVRTVRLNIRGQRDAEVLEPIDGEVFGHVVL